MTGVQTCALPISITDLLGDADKMEKFGTRSRQIFDEGFRAEDATERMVAMLTAIETGVAGRSEERRVGKECRARVSPYPEKKIVMVQVLT